MKPETASPKTHTLILSAILSLIAFIIYLRGLAPSVAAIFDDSLEFPLVVHRLAIAHPTGYPLYILLGKFFSLFNPGNVAYQLNLMSAVFAALSVGLVYRVGLALHSPAEPAPARHAGAAVGALIFGLGPVFFSQATLAEVYTLNALFVAAVLLLCLRQKWLALAFVFGLSLTHHRTMILLIPATVIFAAIIYRPFSRQARQKLWAAMPPLKLGAAFIGPLLLYLYLPLRGAAGSLDGTYRNTLAGFWRHVAGGGYGAFLLGNPFGNQHSAGFYLSLPGNELNWWGLGLAIAGVGFLLWRRRFAALALTGTAFAAYLAFGLLYTVSDIEVFFIPVFLLLALWARLAAGEILNLVWQKQALAGAGLAGLALILLVARPRGHSRAADWAVHDYALDALAQPAPNSVVVGILGEMTLLRYFQETLDLRPDVQTIAADLEGERLARVSELLAEQPARPVYLTRELAGAPERWSLGAAGPLIQVNPAPITAPPAVEQTVNAAVTAAITLLGYAVSRPPSHLSRAPLRLAIVWQATGPVTHTLKISARLMAENGEIAAATDKAPVHFAYPTSLWRPGEFIRDVYDLTLPPDAPPGLYTPLLILYNPANAAAEVGRVSLAPLFVE